MGGICVSGVDELLKKRRQQKGARRARKRERMKRAYIAALCTALIGIIPLLVIAISAAHMEHRQIENPPAITDIESLDSIMFNDSQY